MTAMGLLCGLAFLAQADATTAGDPLWWDKLLHGLIGTLVYGAVGIALGALGFKIFDWITPHIDVEKELAEKQNVAVAIVAAALILGICYIVAVAIH
jgi:putative membrane protein